MLPQLKAGCGRLVRMNPPTELQEALLARASKLESDIASMIPASMRAVLTPEDVIQEVWVKAFQSKAIPRPGDIRSFDAWLATIVARTLANAVKAARRQKRGGNHVIARQADARSESFVRLLEFLDPDIPSPSGDAAMAEAVIEMRKALAEIPEPNRDVIELRFLQGLSREDIAERMGRSLRAIDSLLFRSLRLLKRHLRESGRFFSGSRRITGSNGL